MCPREAYRCIKGTAVKDLFFFFHNFIFDGLFWITTGHKRYYYQTTFCTTNSRFAVTTALELFLVYAHDIILHKTTLVSFLSLSVPKHAHIIKKCGVFHSNHFWTTHSALESNFLAFYKYSVRVFLNGRCVNCSNNSTLPFIKIQIIFPYACFGLKNEIIYSTIIYLFDLFFCNYKFITS